MDNLQSTSIIDGMIVQNKNAGTIKIKQGKNSRILYPHQADAIFELNRINKRTSFSTLVVLPTGAGKTATAVILSDNKKCK